MAVAKLEIICKSCGNTFTWRKDCYNRAAADNAEEWARENVCQCRDCWHKEQIANKKQAEQASSEEYAQQLSQYNLPELTGTEKQVAWATTIRNNALGEVAKLNPTEKFWDLARKQSTAKWWIENRDEFLDSRSIAAALVKASN